MMTKNRHKCNKTKQNNRRKPPHKGDGLFWMDGRMRFADELLCGTRHPILLPKEHPVARLVVVDGHERLGHGARVKEVPTELGRHGI